MLFDLKDKFTKHVIFMFLTGTFGSLSNLIYQLILVRGLSSVDYSVLSSLFSLFSIVIMPLMAFATMVVRYSSMFNAQQRVDKLHTLFYYLFKHNILISLSFALIIFIFRDNLSNFLKLDSTVYIFFLAVIIFFNGILPVIFGFLKGLEKFYWLGSISLASGIIKIIATIIFLKLGWMVYGALFGFLTATLLSIFLSFLPIKVIFSFIKDRLIMIKMNFKEMYFYLIPTLLFTLTITTLTNIDMVLVRHYFSAIDAGYYAVAQIIGKIIFFLPGAIVIVMFPRVSSLHTQDKEHLDVLKKALVFATVLCLAGAVWYNLFPVFTLNLLTGKPHPQSIQLGRLFCVAMSFFSMTNLLSFYHLSISDFKFIKYLVIFTILQIICIALFHSILSVVLVILCINSIILFLINFNLAFAKARLL
jgi:O-antigen/teichoic acid export membrane protein